MVACTNHSVAVDSWAIRNLCGFCNSAIHLHIILMKKIFAHINSVGKIVNKAIVTVLLTLVWLFVIMPYHIFMYSNRGGRWFFLTKLIVKTILFAWDKMKHWIMIREQI